VRDGAGDFGGFVVSRQARLQRMAWLLTGDHQLAEDIVQDALAKLWRNWSRVAAADDIDAYVRRTVVNTYISAWRRRWHGERPVEELPDVARQDAPDIAAQLVVAQALSRLNRRQRSVVVLRFFEDLSIEEVARALGWPVGTVKSTTSKALEALRTDAHLNELVQEVR
jgi:RNA polymerase sigma-70 factor (sigma-E family)